MTGASKPPAGRAGRGHRGWALLRRLRLTPFAVGFGPAPGWTVCVGLVVLVAAAAPAASALATGLVVDAALPHGSGAAAIGPIVAALVLVFLVGQLATQLVATVADAYGGVLEGEIEARTMSASVLTPAGADGPVRGLVDALRDTVPVRQLVTATCQQLMTRCQAVFVGCLIIAYAPLTGLAVLAACVYCAALLESEYDEEQSRAYSVADASRRPRYLSGLAFDLGAAREIKVFRAADWVVRQYDAAAAAAHGDGRNRMSAPVLVSYAAVLVTTVALLANLARSLVHGGISAGEVAVCVSALTGLSGIFAVTMNVVHAGRAATLFDQVRLSGVLGGGPATGTGGTGTAPTPAPVSAPAPAPGSVIRFEGVSYAYPGGEPVFRDLSFELRLRGSLAVVGPNGAGKSTLVRLLTGALSPDSGSITCDGRPVGGSQEDRSRWRSAFAFLGQRFVRYPATLAQNVHLSTAARPLGGPARALLSDLDPRLLAEPAPTLAKGVRDGVDLSGGQWQRVATARAVQALDTRSCRVLVLDEPTAALDAQAEARFFAEAGELAGPGRTTLMVSHRLSGVKNVEEILVLESGTIHERGDHASLMRQQGRYAEMFTAQARRYRD
ncbi:ATP-binding cassette domain-containing protein [Streptantibioticus silvisoli]|uniref:ABC transporter ATP-binding protein n=1 Tax=Streptantibioticus silvisoli TaxID=2705255 RepID=A0ABT6VV02_9ACTN|nr:ABC transporter ATP-binding protein [Streptantibioticus silvisoli]MDI5962309.1 ABC transporter ATP-binding protein [Streptantibioticus silvisoli]